jgi:hypothetical protein
MNALEDRLLLPKPVRIDSDLAREAALVEAALSRRAAHVASMY